MILMLPGVIYLDRLQGKFAVHCVADAGRIRPGKGFSPA
jgi:hypothetical protein